MKKILIILLLSSITSYSQKDMELDSVFNIDKELKSYEEIGFENSKNWVIFYKRDVISKGLDNIKNREKLRIIIKEYTMPLDLYVLKKNNSLMLLFQNNSYNINFFKNKLNKQ